MKIEEYLSKSGIPRRKISELIENGRVTINGLKATKNQEVKDFDKVRIDESIILPEKNIYIIFYKPKNVITTTSMIERPNILDFVNVKQKIDFAGRLDKDAEGLLFLTNDGYVINILTHPRFKVEKEYEIKLNKQFDTKDFKRINELVVDGRRMNVKIHSINKSRTRLKIIISHGEKHILKRIFSRMGYRINKLKRIRIDGFTLKNLRPGEYFFISKREVYEKIQRYI
ncbi:MAG: pseudouridine synthase [Candidatus Woesearchaeota archaeon]